jgi:hypothetical protein
MAEQIVASTIAAPGFMGQNSQDSQVQLEAGFASKAMNCVIDKFGRIGARKGWQPVNAFDSTLGDDPIEFMFDLAITGGNKIVSYGGGSFWEGDTALTPLSVRNVDNTADETYSITDGYWQGAAIPYGENSDAKPHAYFVQGGYSPLVYHELPDPASSDPHSHDSGVFGLQKLSDVGTLPVGYTDTDFRPNCALAAYGRIWLASMPGDKQTVYFSRLLDGSDFQGGDSGSLSLGEVFPNGDQITALAAHNGFLIIFGRNNIAIYRNPIDVTQLELADFIPNIGCVARDSVQNTGTDIVFLSDTGVRSLARVVIEKSLPFRDLSKNVRDELINKVKGVSNPLAIKSVYYDREAFYLLTIPTTKEVYCFDMRVAMQDGSARVTTWNRMDPKSFLVTEDKKLYIGKEGYIGEYKEYSDNDSSYRLEYYTTYFDLGQTTIQKLLKKLSWIIIGGSGQEIVTKWGFDYSESFRAEARALPVKSVSEYNIGEYNIAEYGPGIVTAKFSKQVGGAGTVIQVGLEAEIEANPLSIQRLDVFCKIGKNV